MLRARFRIAEQQIHFGSKIVRVTVIVPSGYIANINIRKTLPLVPLTQTTL